GAERGDLALVVAARVADRVLLQGRVVELWLGEIGHGYCCFAALAMPKKRPNWSARRSPPLASACTAVWTTTVLVAGSTKTACPRTPSSAKRRSLRSTSQVW